MKRVCGEKLLPPGNARRSRMPPRPSELAEGSTLDQFLSRFPTQDHEQHVRTLIQEGRQWLVRNGLLSPNLEAPATGIPEPLPYHQAGTHHFVGLPASTPSTYPLRYSPIQPSTSHRQFTRANRSQDFQSPSYGDNVGLAPGGYHG